MRSVLILLALLFVSQPLHAAKTETEIISGLQGKWGRLNFGQVFEIKANRVEQREKRRPGLVVVTGKLVVPEGEDYAEVKMSNGYTIWFFPIGENNIASESFKPDGVLAGHGHLYYRIPETSKN